MEATKTLEEEADEYHEHLDYQHLQIKKLVREEEEIGSSESKYEEEDVSGKLIVQAFGPNLEEEQARKLKDIGEEIERPPSRERRQEDDKIEESMEPPIVEQQEEGPKHDKEMPFPER